MTDEEKESAASQDVDDIVERMTVAYKNDPQIAVKVAAVVTGRLAVMYKTNADCLINGDDVCMGCFFKRMSEVMRYVQGAAFAKLNEED